MGKAEIERFGKALEGDAALAEQVKAAGNDPAAVAKLAKANGFNFTEQDLRELIASKKGQLSEQELDKASGGGWAYTVNYVAVV